MRRLGARNDVRQNDGCGDERVGGMRGGWNEGRIGDGGAGDGFRRKQKRALWEEMGWSLQGSCGRS